MSKKYAETIKNKNSAILALTLVCLICFLGLAVLTVMLVVQSGKYEGTLEASYQKNVYELVDNIESVEVNMSKIIATNSTSKQKDLLNEIYIACISASANLNALPISSEDISKANNHINKVGGYVVSLIDKVDDESVSTKSSVFHRARDFSKHYHLSKHGGRGIQNQASTLASVLFTAYAVASRATGYPQVALLSRQSHNIGRTRPLYQNL